MVREFEVELVLTGVHEGKTITIRDMKFTNGVGKFRGTKDAVNGRALYMSRCHGAFPKGSDALQRAQRICKEQRDGIRSEVREAEDGGNSNPVSNRPTASNGVPLVEGITKVSADDGHGTTGSSAGPARVLPSGSGHADAGLLSGRGSQVGEPESAPPRDSDPLTDAIFALDPENDEHWTPDGSPSLVALTQITKNAKLTKVEVMKAAADWTREDARQIAGIS